MDVYSTEPPPGASAPDAQGSEQHVWKLRPGEKPCTCKEGCYLQWSGVGGCGCANNGGASSVLCGCGGPQVGGNYFRVVKIESKSEITILGEAKSLDISFLGNPPDFD